MTPALLDVDNALFSAVVEFMVKGFYNPQPVVVADEEEDGGGGGGGGGGAAQGKLVLKGIPQTSQAYSKELERAGRLWMLGRRFEVAGLGEYIEWRVKGSSWVCYERKSLLRFARGIWLRGRFRDGIEVIAKRGEGEGGGKGMGKGNGKGKGRAEDLEGEDEEESETLVLEEWVVNEVAGRFKEIMMEDAKLFFQVAEVAWKRRFSQRVYLRKAEMVEEAGVEVVEID
jgi:hypothetical protein